MTKRIGWIYRTLLTIYSTADITQTGPYDLTEEYASRYLIVKYKIVP
jgi:hypothetical protein